MHEIRLPRAFDIAIVRDVASEIVHALRLEAVTLDAGAVTKVDAAALQLLCAAAIAARARGVPLCWKNVPPVLVSAARTLALAAVLELPAACPLETR